MGIKSIKAEPEPSGSGSGAGGGGAMVEADLGDESYGAGGADGDDNGDFGAEGEFEGFDQYGDGSEFDDSMGAAGGSGAAADGKDGHAEDRIRAYITRDFPGLFKCVECPHLDFACSANVKAHVEYHHYSPGYQCKNCNKVYKVRTVLVKHLKKCAGIRP